MTQPSTGLFGSTATAAQPAQTTSLFGNTAQQQQPQQAGGGLFGSNMATSKPGGLFGGATTATSGGGGLFGSAANTASQPAQTGTSLFGSTTAQQPAAGTMGGGLFGQAKPATSSFFGANTMGATGTTGGGLFGQKPATPAAGGFFGQPAATAPTNSLLYVLVHRIYLDACFFFFACPLTNSSVPLLLNSLLSQHSAQPWARKSSQACASTSRTCEVLPDSMISRKTFKRK